MYYCMILSYTNVRRIYEFRNKMSFNVFLFGLSSRRLHRYYFCRRYNGVCLMLSEFLVLFSCINSSGCSETTAQYFYSHPEVKENIDKTDKRLEKTLGPVTIQYIAPAAYVLVGGTGSIRLNSLFILQFNSDTSKLIFNKEF